jgi:hypothetical protein
MPILLWYFPLIICTAVCDLLFATRNDRRRHVRESSAID